MATVAIRLRSGRNRPNALDGGTLESQQLVYSGEEQKAHSDYPVRFTRGGLSGRGNSMVYVASEGKVDLAGDVMVRLESAGLERAAAAATAVGATALLEVPPTAVVAALVVAPAPPLLPLGVRTAARFTAAPGPAAPDFAAAGARDGGSRAVVFSAPGTTGALVGSGDGGTWAAPARDGTTATRCTNALGLAAVAVAAPVAFAA